VQHADGTVLPPTRTPSRALVVSTGRDRGALAGARALARCGWTVGAGTPTGGGMVAATRSVDTVHTVPRPRGDGQDFVAGVRRAVADGGYEVVIGGGDDWMAALSVYRDELPVPVAHPRFDAVQAALDKVELAEAARAAGLGSPRTVPADSAALEGWQGPVVVKCRSHWSPGQRRPHRIDARIFDHAAAAAGQVQRIVSEGAEPVLQEPVHGHLGAVIGVFAEGRLHARVQQRTSALWPTPSGMSARAETVAVDEDLVARAERMLDRIGWWGLVELQFLTDASGREHLIDLNGRFFGSLALTDAAQPHLVDAWARAALGGALPDLPDAAPGLRYTWLAGDLRRARVERRGGLVADLRETLAWSRTAQHSVWALRDPGPTLQLVRERMTGAHLTPG
jgi:predicted ATP-grasp superfamily ATP-dependent carboligase